MSRIPILASRTQLSYILGSYGYVFPNIAELCEQIFGTAWLPGWPCQWSDHDYIPDGKSGVKRCLGLVPDSMTDLNTPALTSLRVATLVSFFEAS
jgi:hypothetical protein